MTNLARFTRCFSQNRENKVKRKKKENKAEALVFRRGKGAPVFGRKNGDKSGGAPMSLKKDEIQISSAQKR